MKKILVVICALLILWGSMFITDFVRCGSLKEPLFVVGVADTPADDGGSGTYVGPGYTVKVQGELTAEFGFVVQSVEMSVLGKVISASIT